MGCLVKKSVVAVSSAALFATLFLSAQSSIGYPTDPSDPPLGYIPGGPAESTEESRYQGTEGGVIVQPSYQDQYGPLIQPPAPLPPVNPFINDSTYGQSSTQYANPVVPIQPYVPYSELSPPQNAYPIAPYNSPQANQVNQAFMQRYSQQDQDYIRSQFGYPQTFIDPNAGKPPLGEPIRFTDPKLRQGKKAVKPFTPKPQTKKVETPTYYFPGMVALSKRLWVGSDYLFYVPSDIGVAIEVIADKGLMADQTSIVAEEKKLKKNVEQLFQKAGISPQSYSVDNKAPLPFFHLLVMMYLVENKVFMSVTGRYFEEALPARLDLDAPVGTFQAITWEKNEMLIVSASQATEQLDLMVNNITQAFLDGVRYFAEEELNMLTPDDLRDL